MQSTVSGGLSYLTNPNYQSDIPNSSVIDKQVDFYHNNLDYSDKSLWNYLNYGLGYGSGLGSSIQGTVEGSVWTVLNPNEAGNGLLAGIASGNLAEQGYESINNIAAQQVLKNLQNDWAGVGYLSGKFQGDVAQALAPGLIEVGKLGVTSRGKTLLNGDLSTSINKNPNLTGALTDSEAGSILPRKPQSYTPEELGITTNALKPHELTEVKNMVYDLGGTFEGVPQLRPGNVLVDGGKAVSSRDYPNIDGWYTTKSGDSVPVSLKVQTSSNPNRILKEVNDANSKGKDYGIKNATMYVDAPSCITRASG